MTAAPQINLTVEPGQQGTYSPEYLALREKIIQELRETGRSRTLEDLQRSNWDWLPVPPREFFSKSLYAGASLSGLSEKWFRELDIVLGYGYYKPSLVNEWILRGSIGSGKTTAAVAAQMYKLYTLTCLKNPQEFYDLLPGSKIVIGIYCITLQKAGSGYDLMKSWIDQSRYFQDICPRQCRPQDPISFPSKGIEVHIGSLDTHALGEHVFGFLLDEANFFKKQAGELEKTRAHELYTQAKRRQQSRFLQAPGLVTLVSSQRTHTDFLEERLAVAAEDPAVHDSRFSLWETRPPKPCSGKTFFVMIGDGRVSSRLLDEDEVVPEGYETVEVPVEYKQSFDEDLDEALRDIAGRAVVGHGYFFGQRERIHACIDHQREHPFTQQVVTGLSSTMLDSDLTDYLRHDLLFRTRESRSVLRVNPEIPRVAHIDIGLVEDPLGLAIGHVTPTAQIYYDMLLRVAPPQQGEVDLDAIIAFFLHLRKMGMKFKNISYDQYQSKHSLQQLGKAGFKASKVSIGLTEYKTLRRYVYAGPSACSYYYYEPFLRELVELLRQPEGKAPDHAPGKTKDVIDAAAGVAAVLSETTIQDREKEADRTHYSPSRARAYTAYIG